MKRELRIISSAHAATKRLDKTREVEQEDFAQMSAAENGGKTILRKETKAERLSTNTPAPIAEVNSVLMGTRIESTAAITATLKQDSGVKKMMSQTSRRVAVIDADLISRKKHRFPNLACMKISADYKELGYEVVLKTDYEDLNLFDKVFISKVFTDTEIDVSILELPNVTYGGTGFYYDKAPALPDEIEHHMPDYHLYDDWVESQLKNGVKARDFIYYKDYSIGFLTRGCFRKCSFCVNKNYEMVFEHSPLEEFLDHDRKKICLLDDNILGSSAWKVLLTKLKETGKAFQFKQGLDERLLTDEKCELLFSSKYDGDFIFAFDDVEDAKLIEEKISLARKYTSSTFKFYVFCAFDRKDKWDVDFWVRDIFNAFIRIEILMKHRCIPYIMRFKCYEDSPYKGMYIDIARWCNQPSLFKKKSLREFALVDGKKSACYKYLSDFEDEFPEVAYFYDLKFERWNRLNGI